MTSMSVSAIVIMSYRNIDYLISSLNATFSGKPVLFVTVRVRKDGFNRYSNKILDITTSNSLRNVLCVFNEKRLNAIVFPTK